MEVTGESMNRVPDGKLRQKDSAAGRTDCDAEASGPFGSWESSLNNFLRPAAHFEQYQRDAKKSFSGLGDKKELCEECQDSISALAKSKEEKARAAVARARSLMQPNSRPPDPPRTQCTQWEASGTTASKAGPLSQETTLTSFQNTRGSLPGIAPGAQFFFPYSHEWDAGPVEMMDVTEDGMPPDERASDIKHAKVSVTIDTVLSLPKKDSGFGKCDPFVEVRFFEQKFRTRTHKMVYDATFSETFTFFVHAENVRAANMEANSERAAAMGLAIEFECFDYDMFGANQSVGRTSVLLKNVLDAQVQLDPNADADADTDADAAISTRSSHACMDPCMPFPALADDSFYILYALTDDSIYI